MEYKDIKICVDKSPIPVVTNSQTAKNRAVFFKDNKWPTNYTIKVYFDDPYGLSRYIHRTDYKKDFDQYYFNTVVNTLDPIQLDIQSKLDRGISINAIETIKNIISQRISPFINLPFIYLTSKTSIDPITRKTVYPDIIVSFDNSEGAGSWSYIGKDSLSYTKLQKPSMQFGWFDVATVIHEFCHALGLGHEHQNPKGNQIKWNLPEVYKWADKTQHWTKDYTNSNIINRYSTDLTVGTTYDPNSIMLYFYPPELTLDKKGTKQNLRLSSTDATYLATQYPKYGINSQKYALQDYNKMYPVKRAFNIEESARKNKNLIISIVIILLILIGIILYYYFRKQKFSRR